MWAFSFRLARFPRPGRLGRHVGRVRAEREALDSLPYPGDRRFAVRELLDRLRSWNAIPDLDQARSRPLCRQFGQFAFGCESLRVAFRHRFAGVYPAILFSLSIVNVAIDSFSLPPLRSMTSVALLWGESKLIRQA